MASKSNGDDAGSPTPKRTRLSNVDDVNDKQEKMIQALDALKKNPASVLALSKSLSCDHCKSFLRAPIHNCDNDHKVCSICFGELVEEQKNCPAEGCGGMLDFKTFECSVCFEEYLGDCPVEGCGEEELMPNAHDSVTEVVRAMKLPVPCKNRNNGCPKEGNEEEVEDHELECEFRFVETRIVGGGKRMFKDIRKSIEKRAKDREGKWQLYGETEDGKSYKKAFKDIIQADGLTFRIILDSSDPKFLDAGVTVVGGEIVANRYRVEMRLNSSEKEFTTTHHGPVFPIDVKKPWKCEESFTIAKKKYKLFNNGFEHFGDHNKDKNGEVIIPITVKIIKKELNIPKEDSCSGVDMEVEEK